MSKIIYLMPPAHGHMNPALPVMQELVQRGEEVICYNHEGFRPQIERTGAVFRAYPPTALTATAISQVLQSGNLANSHALILRASETLVPFLLEELSRESCDLVIFDSLAVWGKIAATKLRLRAAASISHFVFDLKSMNLKRRELLMLMGQYLSRAPQLLPPRRRLMRRYGSAYPSAQPLFPMRDGLNIVFTTRALQPDTAILDETFRFVGPSIHSQIRRDGFPFEELRQHPVVYISLGTVHHTNTNFYKACFEAFGNHPGQVILSIGNQTDAGSLGATPANFIVRPFVPQIDVLKHSDVFITHGGINSVHEGLYQGVPLIVIPHQLEQLLNARCVGARGAGYVIEDQLMRKHVTVSVLRQALKEVLTKPHYRKAAVAIQTSLHEAGGYRQAADEIQTYIAQGKNHLAH